MAPVLWPHGRIPNTGWGCEGDGEIPDEAEQVPWEGLPEEEQVMYPDEKQMGGLYIHVPFCKKKCAYCDFYSEAGMAAMPRYLAALKKEMTKRADGSLRYDTLYLGGGTPSVLDPDQLSGILETASRYFTLTEDAEITLEANPGTVDLARLKGYRACGINRLNIGIQSFNTENLRFLGRIHTAAEAMEALENAREAGFDNLGLDLIYGIPGQTEASWTRDLTAALRFAPEHLSCYTLTYEPGTPLDRMRTEGLFSPLPDAEVKRLFTLTESWLASSGYERYEVSNFAREKRLRSRHNLKYWSFAPYKGFGPSAHSFRQGQRSWNVSDLSQYVEDLSEAKLPVEETEILKREQLMIEAIYLGLRTKEGIDIPVFEKMFDVRFSEVFAPVIESELTAGRLEMEGDHCFLTEEGMAFLDGVAALFVKCDF